MGGARTANLDPVEAWMQSPLLLHRLSLQSGVPCSRFRRISASCRCCISKGSPSARSQSAARCRRKTVLRQLIGGYCKLRWSLG